MDNPTPMLKQYQALKAQYQNCILFFRLGDFYEMFYEDAKVASPILDVVLTSRDAGKAGRIPMCGIPYHAKDAYISKLIKAGLKVAICEQVEDPALAKGLVKREIIRVLTSGTYIDENNFESRYLLSLALSDKGIGLALIDAFSGQIQTAQYAKADQLINLLSKLAINECIYPVALEDKIREIFKTPALRLKNITLTAYDDWCFNPDIASKALCEHFKLQNLRGFGIAELPLAQAASGALLEYLKQMIRMPMRHIDKITLYADTDFVFISPAAYYGLELDDLFKTMDRSLCPLGKRCLKNWIAQPLKLKPAIIQRQEAVTLLKNNPTLQQELSQLLRNMPDIARNLSRISCGEPSAKDLLCLRQALLRIPDLQKALIDLAAKNTLLSIDDIPEIRLLLTDAISPDIPLSNPEGKIVNRGFNQELDSLRQIQENGHQWLKNLQAREIKRTGINSLKLGFNQVFGYYIEITQANLKAAPDNYIRKQTLANCERFITPELKEFEGKMLTAQENVLRIEKDILQKIYQQILDYSSVLHALSSQIATLDALYSLSILANLPGYIAPQISEDTQIEIKDGRHPVVESLLNVPFIPNDTLLDCQENNFIILTGPNMSGKSTYIRQNAILVIMAQMGSYIPATSAKIGLVDKIFTRIGAHDEITKGQSTFMVEMSETAEILNNLSSRSLIILDEIGRGTSTYDGLSLAWAIAEYLQKQKVRTFFATHFHELTALAQDFPGVKNYNVAVKEWKDEIVFLHKIIPGGTDDSYGIYVAKLAGITKEVLQRASKILLRLELDGKLHDKIRGEGNHDKQLSLFNLANDAILKEIKEELGQMDINKLAPLSALNKLQQWKEKIKENE